MASVDLGHVYLHDASDLETFLRFQTTDRTDARTRGGEVRTYAGGRRRIVTTPRRTQSIGVTLRMVTDDDLDQLEEWAGRLLMYRDHKGRLVFGTFLTFDVADYKGGAEHDVTLSFETATHSIEV